MADGPSIDQAFIEKLTKAVEQNLEDQNFGVRELSDVVGMSRAQIHRRLKKITGQSTSQFIKAIRLEHAMQLLRKKVATASEIAYRVGFGSPTYFSKCFREYYGFPPGEATNKSTEEIESLARNPETVETNRSFIKYRMAKLLGLLAVVVLLAGTYFYFLKSADNGNSHKKSIAVLPLDNLTGDPSQTYFVNGLQDALIGELGQLRNVRVISRTSTRQFKNPDRNLEEIASRLKVSNIIEGSVYGIGDSLRIQLRLIGIESGEHHLWSEAYNENMSDVLNILNEVTREIADEIELTLTPSERKQLNRRLTINSDIYRAYLRGMYYINSSNPDNVRKGVDLLHETLEENPAEPMAYAGLAQGYINLGHGPTPSIDAFRKAKAAALKAIKLDSTLAEAYSALGSYKLYAEYDWEGAEKAFKRANKLNPNLPWNHYHYAWYLFLTGDREEAITEHRVAHELDPLNFYISGWLAWLYAYYGEFALAEKRVDQILRLSEDHSVGLLAKSRIKIGEEKYEEAVSVLRRAVEVNPANRWALGQALVLAGKRVEARQLLKELAVEENNSYNALQKASIYASLGENDAAFQNLFYDPPHARLPWAVRVSPFDSLRNDPRYNNFLARFNLL